MSRSKPNGNAFVNDSTATIGFEAKLWLAADKLLNNMGAAEYKHVVLGLIFLKHISHTFRRDLHSDLRADYVLANPPFNDSDTACAAAHSFKANPKYRS